MTCKIERLIDDENHIVIRVSGRIQSEHVSTIKDMIEQEKSGVALDLTEVTIVDREAVDLFAKCARKGTELRNCPAFLSEWVTKEQQHRGG